MITLINHQDTQVASTILDLQRRSYTVEATLIDYPKLPPLSHTQIDIQTSNETFFGFFDEQELCGILSFKEDNDCLDIHRLCVSPNHFKKGIAQTLLDFVSQNSRATKMEVATAKKNLPAITFYQKNGFVLRKQQKIDDQLTLVFFDKTL